MLLGEPPLLAILSSFPEKMLNKIYGQCASENKIVISFFSQL